MDLHRVAYRVTINYFRDSEIPFTEFDFYVRVITAMLKGVTFEKAVEVITNKPYKIEDIMRIRKKVTTIIMGTINYKNREGSMVIDLKTINEEYAKKEYESGHVTGLLGKKYIKKFNMYYTLEEYMLLQETLVELEHFSILQRREIEDVIQIRKKFNTMKVWFHMYSDKQQDKFFLLLDEDIRRGDSKEVLYTKMITRKIYGRINRDWVDFHINTENFEYKLNTVLDYTFELNKLPKTMRELYSKYKDINRLVANTKLTLNELKEEGYLCHFEENDLEEDTK